MSENALQEEIKRHNELYYRENISEITDAEYDELVKKVGIQTVGASPDDRFSKVQHIVPMLSLNKVYSQDAIYENGVFIKGLTRGDGHYGEDVTKNVATIAGLPKVLPDVKGKLEIRGEVYIRNDDFLKLNKDNKFTNPRNTASGSDNWTQKLPLVDHLGISHIL